MTSSKKIFILLICSFLISVSFSQGNSLQTETKESFSRYAENAEKELIQRRNGTKVFFNTYDSPANALKVSRGEKIISNLNKDDDTPGGIIHDWVGAVFIPETRLKSVIQTLVDYNSHDEIFGEVIDSRLESRSGDSLTAYMRFKKKEIITVVTDTRHDAAIYQISEKKAQLFSRSTRINEVKDFGESNETLLPEGEDHGFLWRMNSYWSLEEKDNGVMVECRSITLSRDIPLGLAFIIGPIINRMPRESLESVLEALKKHLILHPPENGR